MSVKMESYVVKNPIAALYLTGEVGSETADEVMYGMVIKGVGPLSESGYVEVETEYGYRGFVQKEAVIEGKNSETKKWQESDYTIIHSVVDVLSEPKYASVVRITLPRGAKVLYTGEKNGDWEKVSLVDGSFGWVRPEFLKRIVKLETTEEAKLRAEIVSSALSYMGCQYRWGGKTTFGIDCSGLASMAYMLNGWLIPRDAHVQAEALRNISREEAKAGDLFFFPGHVAVCIGDGEYIHATGREGVVLRNSIKKGAENYRDDHDKELYAVGTLF